MLIYECSLRLERDSADSQPELKPTGVSGDLPSSIRQVNDQDPPMGGTETSPEGRPRRSAAIEARNRILSYVTYCHLLCVGCTDVEQSPCSTGGCCVP